MNKMIYFEDNDIIHLLISDEEEAGSVEISPNVTAELNDRGELIGIEMLEASIFLRDFLLDTVQTGLLNIGKTGHSAEAEIVH
ncbi:MAG: DUF2283 domain-containing protein [Desulfococcaceae bacterium]|jgi:uncharacterized protein YuzE|nr:DUF2283 domain-containing protein [Desulfococcaceae bacterium]